jgi:hypothetical protein
VVKRYKSTTILGGGPPGKIVQCQSFGFAVFPSRSLSKVKFSKKTKLKNIKILFLMYPNYLNDRQLLGFSCLNDINSVKQLESCKIIFIKIFSKEFLFIIIICSNYYLNGLSTNKTINPIAFPAAETYPVSIIQPNKVEFYENSQSLKLNSSLEERIINVKGGGISYGRITYSNGIRYVDGVEYVDTINNINDIKDLDPLTKSILGKSPNCRYKRLSFNKKTFGGKILVLLNLLEPFANVRVLRNLELLNKVPIPHQIQQLNQFIPSPLLSQSQKLDVKLDISAHNGGKNFSSHKKKCHLNLNGPCCSNSNDDSDSKASASIFADGFLNSRSPNRGKGVSFESDIPTAKRVEKIFHAKILENQKIIKILRMDSNSYREMGDIDPKTQSSRKELTQLSNDVIPVRTQISGFVLENSEVDVPKCIDEINRRVEEMGYPEFKCSLERFIALATEVGNMTKEGAKEAITVLEGEAKGWYEDVRREDFGVQGIDFVAKGKGDFKGITHIEVKNPVGSAILKASKAPKIGVIYKGKRIGEKILFQKNYWSSDVPLTTIEGINPNAFFPESPNQILALVDLFDVPIFEKAQMQGSILKGAKYDSNIVFLNNNTNSNTNTNLNTNDNN